MAAPTYTIETYTKDINEAFLAELSLVYEAVYNRPVPNNNYLALNQSTHRIILLTREAESQKIVGFKLGYTSPDDASIFLSWVGGTHPNSRKQGIASALMAEQHKQAKNLGYKTVETKCRPTWPEMMALNTKVGFKLIKEYTGRQCGQQKYLLHKQLN